MGDQDRVDVANAVERREDPRVEQQPRAGGFEQEAGVSEVGQVHVFVLGSGRASLSFILSL
jgi:hypothetical protein